MPTASALLALTPDQVAQYEIDGYVVVRGMFSADEVREIAAYFDRLGAEGKPVGGWTPDVTADAKTNPLARYPRVMMPHRFNEMSKRILLDERVRRVLVDLMGEEPIASQTMFYFKPPGAKGQAFHQDNYYLDVRPGTCMAAWLAVDPATDENGGLRVVPGTHKLRVLCPEKADENESFTTHLVKPPAGMSDVPVVLLPGDMLFFNGSLVHGSKGNRHPSVWRRSFISHYIPADTAESSKWYKPYLRFSGVETDVRESTGGGPCGEAGKFSSHAVVP